MAMLLTGEEEFKSMDMNKVIRMCLIHDLGETFTGDIPTFQKTEADGNAEDCLFEEWVQSFPSPQKEEWLGLLKEMEQQQTPEAKTYKAHNESDLSTWLPLEYDLQFTYGKENVQFSEYLKAFRAVIDRQTREKTGH